MSVVLTWPEITIKGIDSIQDPNNPVNAFDDPGPVVTIATPILL